MSFRSYLYACTAWGAWCAYLGWLLGRALAGDDGLAGAIVQGISLGATLGFGLGLVDAVAEFSPWDLAAVAPRGLAALTFGGAGGLLGGLVGGGLHALAGAAGLIAVGWVVTSLAAGAAPGLFDLLSAQLGRREATGARGKVRSGLLGGAAGGVVGGLLCLYLRGAAGRAFGADGEADLWTPGALGFTALGGCVGLAVGLARGLLRTGEPSFGAGRRV